MAKHTASVRQRKGEAPPPANDPAPPAPVPISAATGRRRAARPRSPIVEVGRAQRAAMLRIGAADLTPGQKLVAAAIVARVCSYCRLTDTVAHSQIVTDTGLDRRNVRRAIPRIVAAGILELVPAPGGVRIGGVYTIPQGAQAPPVSAPEQGAQAPPVSAPEPGAQAPPVSVAPAAVENPPTGGAGAAGTGGAGAPRRVGDREGKPLNTGLRSGPGDLEKIDPLGNGFAFVAERVLAKLSAPVAKRIALDISPAQATIVADAWRANDHELRQSLGAVETASNPTAYLVKVCKRVAARE